MMDEQRLIPLCLRGDSAAWEELYRQLQGRIRAVIGWRRWGLTPAEVEDGVQEVFLQLVRALPSFRGESSLHTYVTRLARNRCVSQLRMRAARKRGKEELGYVLEGDGDPTAPHRPAVEPGGGPEEAVLQAEEGSRVARAMLALGLECRQILHLRYYKQYGYKEIAAALEVPLGTVCSRIKRCLVKFRSALDPGQPEAAGPADEERAQ